MQQRGKISLNAKKKHIIYFVKMHSILNCLTFQQRVSVIYCLLLLLSACYSGFGSFKLSALSNFKLSLIRLRSP